MRCKLKASTYRVASSLNAQTLLRSVDSIAEAYNTTGSNVDSVDQDSR